MNFIFIGTINDFSPARSIYIKKGITATREQIEPIDKGNDKKTFCPACFAWLIYLADFGGSLRQAQICTQMEVCLAGQKTLGWLMTFFKLVKKSTQRTLSKVSISYYRIKTGIKNENPLQFGSSLHLACSDRINQIETLSGWNYHRSATIKRNTDMTTFLRSWGQCDRSRPLFWTLSSHFEQGMEMSQKTTLISRRNYRTGWCRGRSNQLDRQWTTKMQTLGGYVLKTDFSSVINIDRSKLLSLLIISVSIYR